MPKKEKIVKVKNKPAADVFQAPKGMRDVLPADQLWWDRIEKTAKELADFYNFGRIDTPILESAELFQRTVGVDSDIVEKEMYVVKTRSGNLLAMRPEGTASVARAYLEHGMSKMGQPQKLFYIGPMFRHENPQFGRLRQFSQVGFEIIGALNDSIYDAQIILLFDRLLKNLKIKNVVLKLNSIGCRVCRPGYKKQLQSYYKNHEDELCADCKQRLKTNPLRLLDCKKDDCLKLKEKAPIFLDKLCASCTRHFKAVLEYLDEIGISYGLDNTLVRGLDYYSQTVFEFLAEGVEVGSIAGGGRYDYLMELIGGRITPAVGGAVSFERLIEVMKSQDVKLPVKNSRKVFLIHVGDLAKKKSLKIVEELRGAGIVVAEALGKESIKSQLKVADKQKNLIALILGQKEIFEESIIIRDLHTGLQETVLLSKMVSEIQRRWKEKSEIN